MKTSNTVFPEDRETGGRCACMKTIIENCKVIGMVNLKVLVSGSIFLGKVHEPIRSTNDPYSKMDMGIPFTKRPKSLIFDYKVKATGDNYRTLSTGFSSMKKLPEKIVRKYIYCFSIVGKMPMVMYMRIAWVQDGNDL